MYELKGNYPTIGALTPKWMFETYTGKKYTSDDFKGQVVIIDFWATWCGSGILAMPHLQKLHEKYKGKVKVLGLTLQEKADPVAFAKKKGLTFTIDKTVAEALQCGGLPLTIVIDTQGNIADYLVGYRGKAIDEVLDGIIEQCLTSKKNEAKSKK